MIDMMSSKIFTSVIVCGSVKQPCNPELKGRALAATDLFWLPQAPVPALLQARGACPCLLELESPVVVHAGQSKGKELAGMVTHPPPAATGRTGQHSHSWGDATLPGACFGGFLFVPFNGTGNPREGSHPSAEAVPLSRATKPCQHCLPDTQDAVPACSFVSVNTSVPKSIDRKSVLEYFYFVNYTA